MDKREIVKMLEYSALSYKDVQPKQKNEILTVIDDKETDIQCYIRKSGNRLLITFRGSDSLKDWAADFKFWKKTIPYDNKKSKIQVHSGFLGTYKSKNVRGKIHSLATKDIEKIQITGHSYGAALATLCALDLEYNFPEKDYEVILFGSPRVGNGAFKKSYDKRVFKTLRVENKMDIVTKIPFMFLGYRHVGTKISVGNFLNIFSKGNHHLQKYYRNFFKF